MKMRELLTIFLIGTALTACRLVENTPLQLVTDKAHYLPGDTVVVTIIPKVKMKAEIRVYDIDCLLAEEPVTVPAGGINWCWPAPSVNSRGYLIEVTDLKTSAVACIGVDVSSDWSKYARYGFLSSYDEMTLQARNTILQRLNRLHISALHFYDYHHEHHNPVKTEGDEVASVWCDVAGRKIYSATVAGYIQQAHEMNMKCMAYNLLYGAWEKGLSQDVNPDWALFRDPQQKKRFTLVLPDSWADNIVLMNPGNPDWQDYLLKNTQKIRRLNFDGWDVDQIGDIRPVYDNLGQPVKLDSAFGVFLQKAQKELKMPLVMNAVNQYGQEAIVQSNAVSFLYTEVWDPDTTYADLVKVIRTNNRLCSNQLTTVLKAYMNYAKSGAPGTFNTPGVLLTDAVIFASGAAHLELGEHMLCHEYFPNHNLKMSPELEAAVVRYYDFMTAYETLLRDSRDIQNEITAVSSEVKFSALPEAGNVWLLQRETKDFIVLQLVNFTGMNNMKWRDPEGTCPEPPLLDLFEITLNLTVPVSEVLAASPDSPDLCVRPVAYSRKNGQLSFVSPSLKYWNMILLKKER